MSFAQSIEQADLARNQGNLVQAERFYNEAIVIAETIEERAKALQLLAVCANMGCNYHLALRRLQEVRAVAEQKELNDILVAVLRDTGMAFARLDDYAQAMDYLAASERLAARESPAEGNFDGQGIAKAKMGWVAILDRDLTSAEHYLNQAVGILRRSGNTFFLGTTLIHHAELRIAERRYNEATKYLDEALSIFETNATTFRWRLIQAYGLMGYCYAKLDDIASATHYLDESNQLLDTPTIPDPSKLLLRKDSRIDETAQLIGAV